MKKVLFIDDDRFITELYRNVVCTAGYVFVSAADGRDGIEKLDIAPFPDLIILDLNMPGISGVELLKIIRSKPALNSVPIIILTSGYLPGLLDEVRPLGVHKVFQKTQFSPKRILTEIEDSLKTVAENKLKIKPLTRLEMAALQIKPEERMPELFGVHPQIALHGLAHRYHQFAPELEKSLSMPKESPAGKHGRELKELFEYLYENPNDINAQSARVLTDGMDQLNRLLQNEPG